MEKERKYDASERQGGIYIIIKKTLSHVIST